MLVFKSSFETILKLNEIFRIFNLVLTTPRKGQTYNASYIKGSHVIRVARELTVGNSWTIECLNGQGSIEFKFRYS